MVLGQLPGRGRRLRRWWGVVGWVGGAVLVEDDRLVVLFDEVGYKTLALAAVMANDLLRPRT